MALLAASENRWLRERAVRAKLVRRAAARFMPGEHVEDALRAAAPLQQAGLRIVLTQLGENVADPQVTDQVAAHYANVLATIRVRGLDCHLSVKPTQLGLDIDEERCYRHLRSLALDANSTGSFLWIDMEQHTYVDRTLQLYRRLVSEFPTVGVCLQAYLHRTASDLASLEGAGGIRLVKGAYREPASVAYQSRHDVDTNFDLLADRLLRWSALRSDRLAVFGTHDRAMIASVQRHADQVQAGRELFEFHLLYGIQSRMQAMLAAEGYRVRVLISYGEQWFPWYMRRLAERPANVWFAVKSAMSR